MKSSASPCPLDQISVICFEIYPFLRSYLTEIIRCVWSSGQVPLEWNKACTVLAHKKGTTDDPANFHPITLQSVPLKKFTSCLRNSIFDFLQKYGYVKQQIQKGFTRKLSGTLEHTAQLGHMINKARNKQRSIVVSLLDLKNAYGEVHHYLIPEVLKYHHVPEEIQHMIPSLYKDFHTSVINDDFHTSFIPVKRGVLQGDCLSPLIFNMYFNTFIQFVKEKKYQHLNLCFMLWMAAKCIFNKVAIPGDTILFCIFLPPHFKLCKVLFFMLIFLVLFLHASSLAIIFDQIFF